MPLTYRAIARTLDREGRTDEAIEVLEKAVEDRCRDGPTLNLLGLFYDKQGLQRKARDAFREALEVDPSFLTARVNLGRLYRKAVPPWHFSMMNDPARNEAYDRAIGRAVRERMLVLDVGTGSGLLAMMAARAGAGHVFACEENPLLAEKAVEIVRRNGLGDRITVIPKNSVDLKVGVDLPRRMDLLVTETFDAGLLGEGALPVIDHARRHLLVEDPSIIPRGATVFAALVESEELRAMTSVGRVCGFDLGAFEEFAALFHGAMRFDRVNHRLLTGPFEVFSFDLLGVLEREREAYIPVAVAEDGVCHAVLLWFRLRLDDEYGVDTAVGGSAKSWGQAVQTFSRPVRLTRGDEITLHARHLSSLILVEPLFTKQGVP